VVLPGDLAVALGVVQPEWYVRPGATKRVRSSKNLKNVYFEVKFHKGLDLADLPRKSSVSGRVHGPMPCLLRWQEDNCLGETSRRLWLLFLYYISPEAIAIAVPCICTMKPNHVLSSIEMFKWHPHHPKQTKTCSPQEVTCQLFLCLWSQHSLTHLSPWP
jgi:hypothetical protein